MRKILFAFLVLAGCADNGTSTGDDDGSGDGGGGGGGGGGSDDGSGGGDGTGTADVQRDYDDVASLLGQNLVAGELAAMVDGVDMAYGRMPAGFTVTDHIEYFTIVGIRGGLSVEYKLHCRDTIDALTVCNGLEDHAHVYPTYRGTGVERRASWTVRNLTTQNVRITGDGWNNFAAQLDTGSYKLAVRDELAGVLLAPTPTMPTGGEVTLAINVERTRETADPATRTFVVAATIRFGATATITLDGTQSYALDLATGTVVKN
jgi:hypothetical protein